jgi:hypothetical protein
MNANTARFLLVLVLIVVGVALYRDRFDGPSSNTTVAATPAGPTIAPNPPTPPPTVSSNTAAQNGVTLSSGVQSAANTSQQPAGGSSNNQSGTTLSPIQAGLATQAAQAGIGASKQVNDPSGTPVGVVGTVTVSGVVTLAPNACVDYDPRSDSVTGEDWTITSADGTKARSYSANGGAVLHAKYTVTEYFTPCIKDPKSL